MIFLGQQVVSETLLYLILYDNLILPYTTSVYENELIFYFHLFMTRHITSTAKQKPVAF